MKSKNVREPVQVYLDKLDQQLLAKAAQETGLSKAEVLRRGLRRFAASLTGRDPGWSLEQLIGAFGSDPSIPRDLAVRHDEYLYRAAYPTERRGRRRAD